MTKKQMIKNGLKYQFKNESRDDKHILTLSGVVAKPDWIDRMLDIETINAQDIADALDDVNKDILIKLNSGGGDAFEGIEIYNYLKNHESHVTIEVTALAASAASIIAMSGDEIVMDTGSSMMIHQASTLAWGDKGELSKAINALETIDGSLVDIYAEQTGLDKTELDELLVNETWFTADEAVEKGFAHRKSTRQAVSPEAEEKEPFTASVNVSITDMEEFKNMMSAVQNEIKEIKNNTKPQNQEPKKRLYF